MTLYNWQQSDWPNFRYDLSNIVKTLMLFAEKAGIISEKIAHLNEDLKTEALIGIMMDEAIKTSEIESEYISCPDVRSSIKNLLGLNDQLVSVHDKRAQGVVELLFDARNTFDKALTKKQLFNWHLMLLSASKNPHLRVGYWRTRAELMQIVSSYHDKWTIHFEAPPSASVPQEMDRFIRWFNDTRPDKSRAIEFAPVRAAITHLYFESIHPFEDGNGRIGRALAEKALSQGMGYPVLLSLSKAIEANKKRYYAALNTASHSNEITPWIEYFVDVIVKAQIQVEQQINFILKKSKFLDSYQDRLNERQLKVIKRILQEGMEGFEGGISAKKYMTIAKVSKATATRDLTELFTLEILKKLGSGRNVRYELNLW